MNIQHHYLTSGSKPSPHLGEYYYEWDDGVTKDKVQLFFLIDVHSTKLKLDGLGDEIFELFKSHFFTGLEQDAYTRFEDSLKAVNELILEKEKKKKVKFKPNVHTVLSALSGNSLYVSQHGNAQAYLMRSRHITTLTEDLSEHSDEDTFTNIAYGDLESDDLVILSTSHLLQYVSKQDLMKMYDENELGTAAEDLSEAIHNELENQAGIWSISFENIVGNGEVHGVEGAAQARGSKAESVISDFMGWLKDRLALSRKKKGSRSYNFFDEWRRMGRDRILIVLVLIVAFLVVGIFVVRNQGNKQRQINNLEATLDSVEEKINTAETKGTFDKETAAALLSEAESDAKEVLSSGLLRGRASEMLVKVDEQRNLIDGVRRITAPTLIADLTAKRSTVSALGILPYDNSSYVYEYNGLYEIMISEVKDPITIDDSEVVVDGTYFEDRDSLVFFTQADKLIEYRDGFFQFVDTADSAWRNGVAVDTYSNKTYVLDPSENQIWKYTRLREGYSGASEYNKDADLSNAIDMAIDSSVWVLEDGGTIKKLYAGEDTPFTLSKAPLIPFDEATKIFTEFDNSDVYVVDPEHSRVLVFRKDKDGNLEYVYQYILDNVDEIKDISVDKNTQKLYVLTSTKLYEIDEGDPF